MEQIDKTKKTAEEAVITKEPLGEDELMDVAGGFFPTFTENRYEPAKCRNYTKAESDCRGGLTGWVKCDHYRREENKGPERLLNRGGYRHFCVMGIYNYLGDDRGNPRG